MPHSSPEVVLAPDTAVQVATPNRASVTPLPVEAEVLDHIRQLFSGGNSVVTIDGNTFTSDTLLHALAHAPDGIARFILRSRIVDLLRSKGSAPSSDGGWGG